MGEREREGREEEMEGERDGGRERWEVREMGGEHDGSLLGDRLYSFPSTAGS